MSGEPLAYMLTWVTYGTWLPGDARGWIEYRNGWKLPSPMKELEATASMTENACRLTIDQRRAVESQIAQTCQHRNWHLHAVNCRINHLHVVVTAALASPKKVRVDLKAWSTRCLREQFDPARENWWAERGSIRFLNSETELEGAVAYVQDAQDRKWRDFL
jgi:REP element-mobilizing transposase RayT